MVEEVDAGQAWKVGGARDPFSELRGEWSPNFSLRMQTDGRDMGSMVGLEEFASCGAQCCSAGKSELCSYNCCGATKG